MLAHLGIIITYLLLGIKILSQNYSHKQLLFVLIGGIVSIISWHFSGHHAEMIELFLFIAACEKVALQHVTKISIFSLQIIFLPVIFSWLKIIEDYTLPSNDKVITLRHSYGYSHPNYLAMLVFLLFINVLFYEKTKKRHIIITLTLSLLTSVFITESSTYTIATLLTILSYFFYTKKAHRKKLFIILVILDTVTIAYSLITVYSYSTDLSHRINSLINQRLALAYHYGSNFPPLLWGRNITRTYIPWIDTEGNFLVDNTYQHLLLRYGILISFIFCISIIMYILHKIKASSWDIYLLGLSIFAIIAFVERAAFLIYANYFLIALSPMMMSSKNMSELTEHTSTELAENK
ncbi:MAG: hypothetical protein J6M18_02845 [Actinomycetaceae bacterium]|nr:hypothetical protein [Actinomycetaceae bacterium]